MSVDKSIWALIPARGGSKSIPYKNIFKLNGRPLIDYQVLAARAATSIDRIICSTDDEKIAGHCRELGIDVHERPIELASDSANVVDAIKHFLLQEQAKGEALPYAVALLQPTSPFLLPAQIDACSDALRGNPGANSSQTVADIPHNYHAFNQRVIKDGTVDFNFTEERKVCYNKQSKPHFYSFGNLVITRSDALLADKGVFAVPSVPVEIPTVYAYDFDGPQDVQLAELYLSSGMVELGHL